MNDNKNTIFSGVFWVFSERFLAQGISFIISTVLARILMPEDYGVVAISLVFIDIASVFVNSGFSTSLIQNSKADSLDFSTNFYCSLITSIILYIIIFFVSPYVAGFYNIPLLSTILRVYALKLPIGVYNTIQHAYVSRNMLFKKFFFSTLGGTLISGVLGITMAYMGYGVWALIGQAFCNLIVDTVILNFTIPWHPQLVFSWDKAKKMMKYGIYILLADLSGTVVHNLNGILIGKYYTPSDLAYFNRGESLPNLLNTNFSSALMSVLFPAFANKNENTSSVCQLLSNAIKIITYVIFPAMIGLAIIAEPLVVFLFTEKWLDSVIFLQFRCIAICFEVIGFINLQTIKAIGRSDVVLHWELVKKVVHISLLVLGLSHSIQGMAFCMIIASFFGMMVNTFLGRKYVGYTYARMIKDVGPGFLMSLIMGICLYWLHFDMLTPFMNILIKVLLGILIYGVISVIFKPEAYVLGRNFVLNRLHGNNTKGI